MLLEKLVIENYGVYADRSEFILTTSVERPIIVVGGLNGAGKTTLFESMMIALYGRAYLGRKVAKKRYLKFIADRVHSHGGRRANHASVEITFRFHHNGSVDLYVVNRSWDVEGASVTESLLIQKNGRDMIDINESLWQQFVEGLIPLGIARLFFFDGEKIAKITKWNDRNNEELKSSLDMLLGAELINRLRSDLNLYTIRKSGKTRKETDKTEQEYEAMQQEKDRLSSDIEELEAEQLAKNEGIKQAVSQISFKESKIASVGGGYAGMREDLLTQKASLEGKITSQRRYIQDDLAEDAPFHLNDRMLRQIQKQITADMDVMRQRMAASLVGERMQRLKDDLRSSGLNSGKTVDNEAIEKICDRLNDLKQVSGRRHLL